MRVLVRFFPKAFGPRSEPVLEGLYDLRTGELSIRATPVRRSDWRDRFDAPRWTPAEDALLREHYAGHGLRAAMRRLPHRTRRSIEGRALKLGVLAPHGVATKAAIAAKKEAGPRIRSGVTKTENTPGASGTARKASSVDESTSTRAAASVVVERIEDRAPSPEPEAVAPLPAPTILAEKPLSAPSPRASVVDIFRQAAAPYRQKAAAAQAPAMTIGVSQARKPVPIGWVEQYQARLRAARAFLQSKGFSVSRLDPDATIPRWCVFGIRQTLGNDELIALAAEKGFSA